MRGREGRGARADGQRPGRYTCPAPLVYYRRRRAGHPGGCRLIADPQADAGSHGDYSSQSASAGPGRGIGQSERRIGVIDVRSGAIRCAGESKHARPPGGVLTGRPADQ